MALIFFSLVFTVLLISQMGLGFTDRFLYLHTVGITHKERKLGLSTFPVRSHAQPPVKRGYVEGCKCEDCAEALWRDGYRYEHTSQVGGWSSWKGSGELGLGGLKFWKLLLPSVLRTWRYKLQ